MAKKKILFISTKSVLGGAQRYIVDLVDYLPKNEFETAIAAGGHGPLAQRAKERAVPYYEILKLERDVGFFSDISALIQIYRLLRHVKPDILHINGSKVSVAGAIAGRLAGVKKIVSSTHGWPFLEERPPWQKRIIRLVTKLGALFQDRIICVSEFDYMIGLRDMIANPKKLVLIRNGIDPRKHLFLDRDNARKKLLSKENLTGNNYFFVGTIAEYTKNKGLYYIIEAAAHSVDIEPRLLFFLIGWGEEKEFLEHHIELRRLQKNVFLVDYLPVEAFTYLKAFDLFLLPSIKEGFAYTLLEASLAELPIITTQVGGNPEIIENLKNGFLIKPTSPEEIINAISYFIKNPQTRSSFGEAARAKVLKDFTIAGMIERTKKIYLS